MIVLATLLATPLVREIQDTSWGGGGAVGVNLGPNVTSQPVDYTGLENSTATFTLTATSGNASALTYQWQEYTTSWGNLANAGRVSGVTTTTLTVATVPVTDNNRMFRCRVTNTAGSDFTVSVKIIVTGAFWYITDQLGNRLIDEPAVDYIVDERSL